MRPTLFAVPFAALLAGLVPPAAAQVAPVTVSGAWARATAGGQDTGAAYATLLSPGADRLVSVSTPVAGAAEVHAVAMDGNVMRMRPVAALDLPAGKPVTLAPGGLHLMLLHLRAPLVAGQAFPVHLTFAHAPAMDVTVTVEKLGAMGPSAGSGK